MPPRTGEVVQGFTATASDLLKKWNALASSAAAKVDAGAYDPRDAAEDAAAGARLAAEAGWLWTSLWWEALGACAGLEGQPSSGKSQPFYSPLPGARLKLGGPLVKGPGLDALQGVRIEPEQLEPGKTEFHLHADAVVCRAGTYVGTVIATTDGGEAPVWVWISIP